MTKLVLAAYRAAARYFNGNVKLIQHYTKVLQFATLIGEGENLSADELETLQIAAIVHDIGIPESERKYGNCNGNNQELEGPPVARMLLAPLDVQGERLETVCHIIACHHSYSKIGDNLLLRIVVEADMLVNAFDDALPKESLIRFTQTVAQTATGKTLFADIYGV